MKEYGRKPYIAKSYHDMMTKKTNQDVWNTALVKQSEYEKPYISDTYEEMLYYAPVFPGLSFDVYDFDFENIDPYAPLDPYNPWHIIFGCEGDLCFCKNQTKCFSMNCAYPIIGIKPTWGYSCGGLSFEIGNGQICITADSDPQWGCEVDILMVAKIRGVKTFGRYSGMGVYECDSKECCIPDPSMAWDSGTSAETVARNNSCTVAITGNNTPFTWSVSGTGFTLDNASTTGLTNTLNADGTACGSATITVTGCDGTIATGYVRCTTGQWVTISSCGVDGQAADTCTETTGKTKVTSKCKNTCAGEICDLDCIRLCDYGFAYCDAPNCTIASGAYFWCTFYTKTEEWQC